MHRSCSLVLTPNDGVIESRGTTMTIERTILLVVGVVITGSVLASVYVSPLWLWVTGGMGAHLIQASFTGLCPVVAILKRLGLTSRPAFG